MKTAGNPNTEAAVKERIEKLREAIDHHRYLYHVEDRQEISEAALDSLKHELYELEQRFPRLIIPDSPTQRVGGKALDAFKKVPHASRMLSMEDVFSREEFEKWVTRIEKYGERLIDAYFCMQKIDGLAISLVYKNGVLETAATRGDGRVGEDVTQNIKTIEAVPLRLTLKNPPPLVEVRGEVFMSKKDFEQMNQRLEKEGKPTFANPRNVSAGSVRQLDSAITASRPLDFRAWHLVGVEADAQDESFARLREIGFKTVEGTRANTMKVVEAFFDKTGKHRKNIAHWIDGVVVRVNDHKHYAALGVVGKTPRGLVAWKFPPEEATTRVLDVEWSVGRTGRLTPIARVEPTFIAGTTVQNASLHNFDEIERLDIRIGDTVILTKAGDIIPKIISVLKELRTGKEKPIVPPSACPVCGDAVVRQEGQVDIACTNANCYSMERERILHAARAFGIDGLGGKRIEHFLNAGLLASPPDIFRLAKGDIEQIDGYKEKSAAKIVDEIQSKKHISFPHFIVALGIPNVGAETANAIANRFPDVGALMQATREELMKIEDIGEIVADSIVEFFANDRVRSLVADFEAVGVVIELPQRTSNTLAGKTFVLTGTMESLGRDEAQQAIRERGGSVSGSVSKKTDFVVVGENPGSKAQKAEAFGVKILSEQAFLRMLG